MQRDKTEERWSNKGTKLCDGLGIESPSHHRSIRELFQGRPPLKSNSFRDNPFFKRFYGRLPSFALFSVAIRSTPNSASEAWRLVLSFSLFNATIGQLHGLLAPMSDEPEPFVRRVAACLTAANWSYTADERKKLIWLLCGDNVSSLRLTLICKDRESQVLLFISLERRCPAAYRTTMANFCNRANFDIALGFWAVDFRDGEVRFRHAAPSIASRSRPASWTTSSRGPSPSSGGGTSSCRQSWTDTRSPRP
jgi:hypothetical protein